MDRLNNNIEARFVELLNLNVNGRLTGKQIEELLQLAKILEKKPYR